MAALASAPRVSAFTQARLPARLNRKSVVVKAAAADRNAVQEAVVKATAFGSLAGSFLAAGHAQAAMEVANIAASDNRFGVIASLAIPVLGWVGFNILGPLQNQLAAMDEKKARSVAMGLGLSATALLAAGSADAAEVMQLAAGDNRFGVIALLFLPVLGWVGFNIFQPFLNQLAAMEGKKKGVAAGLGLGAASLLAAGSADAAEVMQLAAGDNRFGVIALLFLPVLGWVGFNIFQPFLNQLAAMEGKKKGVAAGLGLGAASLLAAGNADAAEVMQLAAGDNRFGVIALLFLPVLGWVGFNIFQPFLNQLAAMDEKKRGVAAGLGLGAASLLAASSADAAEVMQLAASDNRFGVIASLAIPVLGWVGFNILGPLQNQLAAMDEKRN